MRKWLPVMEAPSAPMYARCMDNAGEIADRCRSLHERIDEFA
jgi:hypothetical protein